MAPFGTEWTVPSKSADHGSAEAHLLHGPGSTRDRDDVAHAVRVLAQDEHAVQVVADELLGAEPDRAADGHAESDAQAADGRPDRRQEGGDGDDHDERDDEPAHEPEGERGKGLQAPPALRAPGGQPVGVQLRLAGKRGGSGPGDEGSDEAGQQPVGKPGHQDHDRDDQRAVGRVHEVPAQPVRDVLHRVRL